MKLISSFIVLYYCIDLKLYIDLWMFFLSIFQYKNLISIYRAGQMMNRLNKWWKISMAANKTFEFGLIWFVLTNLVYYYLSIAVFYTDWNDSLRLFNINNQIINIFPTIIVWHIFKYWWGLKKMSLYYRYGMENKINI